MSFRRSKYGGCDEYQLTLGVANELGASFSGEVMEYVREYLDEVIAEATAPLHKEIERLKKELASKDTQ